MTTTPVSELPDDIDLTDLPRETLERVRRNREDEAGLNFWRVVFNEVQQPDALWTLQIRYVQSNGGMIDPDLPKIPPVVSLDNPAPPPAGPLGHLVSARRTLPTTVVYIDEDGRDIIREGGSRSWRNCNPGNIRKGSFAIAAGAIGDDNSFAIFPEEAVGQAAIAALLMSPSYRSLTLNDAIFRYAPPSENNSAAYASFIVTKTGIAASTVLDTLSPEQIDSVCSFIKEVEGWKVGSVRPNTPNSAASAVANQASGISAAVGAAQDWMAIAQREASLPEHERSAWPGAAQNPRILEYFKIAAPWFETDNGDETDWCAAFANYCLVSSGHVGTDHPGARSFFWNRKGQFVRLNSPIKGAIAVRRYSPFDDAIWKVGPGHVAFVVAFTSSTLTLMGGNQSGSVNVQSFPLETTRPDGTLGSRFVAYMMPVMT